jgi:hypothetical protein
MQKMAKQFGAANRKGRLAGLPGMGGFQKGGAGW